jgi:hypothetical protein
MIGVLVVFAQETGYLVTVQKVQGKTECHKLTDPAQVDSLMNKLSDKQFSETTKLLSNSLFYEIRTTNYNFYCEKKELSRTKKGHIKLKRIKQLKSPEEMKNTMGKMAKL